MAAAMLSTGCGGGTANNNGGPPAEDEFPSDPSETVSGDSKTCRNRIAGGDTQATTVNTNNSAQSCVVCGSDNLERAIDDDPASAALIHMGGATDKPENGWGLRVTAQRGVVYPAGSVAAAVVSFPEPILSGSVYLRTLLDGTVQDGAMVHSTLIGSYANKRYVGVKTKAPYNMVEVIISPAGASDAQVSPADLYLRPGAGRMALDIYEVCSD